MLAPHFECIPQELRSLPRWVLWKDAKVPYCATALESKASPTSPDTWACFDQTQTAYEEGGYLGVGFTLNGDGIAGVDLDNCVEDGKPSPHAIALLERIGCQYTELSPSGGGLRGFGYAENITTGKKGVLDGVHVELYTNKRYLTVTGHTIKNGPLVALPGFTEVANSLGKKVIPSPTPQKTPEVQQRTTDSHLLLSSVGCDATTPTSKGQRNKCLFELARRYKAANPSASKAERRELVQQWYAQHLNIIGTKELTVSLDDFERSWESVKYLPGATLRKALEGVNIYAELPPTLTALGYTSHDAPLLNFCMALQTHEGSNPFFLSARVAAEILGHTDHSTAAAMLRTFVRDGVLELVSKGAGKKASRYAMQSIQKAMRCK